MKLNKEGIKNHSIIIPLHLPISFPSDYTYQTGKQLSKRNKVIFFDFRYPISWKSFFNFRNNLKFLKTIKNLFRKKNGWLYFRPLSLLPFQHVDFIYNFNVFLGIIQLRILLFFSKLPIITWIFSPITQSILGKLGEDISIYDCNDYYGDEKTSDLIKDEEMLLKKVAYVIFNSKELMEQKISEYPEIKNKSSYTVCGCDVFLFNKIPSTYKTFRTKNNKINVLLVGQLNYRIDFSLLYYLVKNNPQYNFIIIGPVYKENLKDFKKIADLPNTIYLGEKPKESIPYYFYYSQIGIIPYDLNFKSAKYCNPMKAYEYLASGMPVISTSIAPLKHLPSDIVYTTDDKEEFGQAIKRLIENWNDKKIKIAKNIAKKNSWENKVDLMEKIIKKNEKTN